MTKRYSVKTQISVYVLLVSLLSSVIIGVFSYLSFKYNLENYVGQRARDLAQAISLNIDGDAIKGYDTKGTKDDQYKTIRDYLSSEKERIDLTYLYIMVDDGDNYKYIVEGQKEGDDPNQIVDLGDTQSKSDYGAEPQQALLSDVAVYTPLYDNGQYGVLLSGFAPILDSNNQIVGLVGLDISASSINESIGEFIPILIAIMLAVALITFILIRLSISHTITKPLLHLEKAAVRMSDGDFDTTTLNRYTKKNNELGSLTRAFETLSRNLIKIKNDVKLIEDKKLTISDDRELKGDFKTIKNSIQHIVDSYNDLLSDFSSIINELSDSSVQVAQISQNLAIGSTEQSASISDFSEIVAMLSNSEKTNADSVVKATAYATEAERGLEKCNADMHQVLSAMENIHTAAGEISRIMNEISDISAMTNLLALNASVESARAGASGKGFAVVATEVRNLAAKSAAATKKTEELITKSISAAEKGMQITEITERDLSAVSQKAQLVVQAVNEISALSSVQGNGIRKITKSIGTISNVVYSHSAKADESAAASTTLSSQAIQLERKINEYLR